ncbi:entericidin A/B family lipoprotein [Flocculibacter collagenilyticus]|nr:entericidin A/B family lipoprotein [Flocculibacter collagenilyticus]
MQKLKNNMLVFRLVLVSAVLMVFSGCATMEGVGKDVESAGEEIQEAARD